MHRHVPADISCGHSICWAPGSIARAGAFDRPPPLRPRAPRRARQRAIARKKAEYIHKEAM